MKAVAVIPGKPDSIHLREAPCPSHVLHIPRDAIYLMKLPRLEKRLRVALDWTWDLVFSKDLVKFLSRRKDTVSQPQEDVREVVVRAAG